jgi:hypothetical protein
MWKNKLFDIIINNFYNYIMFCYKLYNFLKDPNAEPSFRSIVFKEIYSMHKSIKKCRIGSYFYKSFFLQVMTPVCTAVALPFFLLATVFAILKSGFNNLKEIGVEVLKELTYSLYVTMFMPLIVISMPFTNLKKEEPHVF